MTAERKSEKIVSDMEVHMKQKCVIEFLHAECNFCHWIQTNYLLLSVIGRKFVNKLHLNSQIQ